MNKVNVGIDLGTTYSAVALFDEGTSKIKILKNEIGEETTPSVVYVEGGQTLIGQEAKDLQASGNTNTASFYKSQMGEPNYSAYLDGKDYSAEDLSAIFLKYLKKQIEETNNVEIEGAVITCPAYFNEAQRQATIHAGERAGLKVLKILNEPTAAIIAYGLTGVGTKNVMVYDLGGGTFDVTIAKIVGPNVTPLCTNGNHQLGGRDWDRALIDFVVDKFNNEFGIDITAYPEDFNELMVKCEKAKKVLTNVPSTTIAIQCDGMYGKYEITRQDFDAATENLLNETMLLTEQCFTEIGGGFSWKNLDEVVLVGGSTRMPQIAEAVEREFGKKPRIIGNKVDSIVAAGAAMQAHLCKFGSLTLNPVNLGMANFAGGEKPAAFTLSNNSIKDITSHSLGLLIWENEESDKLINSIVIKKNSNVGEDFDKSYNYQGSKMEAYVLQGETEDPYDANILYKYEITGFPSGKNQVIVSYLYNQNGVVEVKAKIQGGKSLDVKQCPITESLSEIEGRLKKEKAESRKPVFDVTFMIDVSGSMYGSGIKAAVQAVEEFVNQIDLSFTHVSLISFADNCRTVLDHEQNKSRIMSAVNGLDADGGTSADPFDHYLKHYQMNTSGGAAKPRFSLKSAFGGGGSVEAGTEIIIVLTDGEWWEPEVARRSADSVKNKGATIYAVGVADSNQSFLNQIASPGCAKKVDLSQLVTTFKSIGSSLASGN